jgi:hypothetical protein
MLSLLALFTTGFLGILNETAPPAEPRILPSQCR